ncbi:MAG: ClpXP protease specificity-enhancing factor [Beggiatoa sp. IS2]|nr:MAG: ClpXP protease specificity-enhancing factor [Beggiatoa sp. IS2]
MTPTRPYLLRAIYEWITDNGFTPFLLVNAENSQVTVPNEYVKEGKIILNIAGTAVSNLSLENDRVFFDARFAGRNFSVFIPMQAVLAVYAKENGKGMFFQPEDYESTPPPIPPRPTKPVLKRVK